MTMQATRRTRPTLTLHHPVPAALSWLQPGGDLRQALESTSEEYDRFCTHQKMSTAPNLLTLFSGILADFTSQRRPSCFVVPAARDCDSNDRHHVAAVLRLRYALEAAYELLEGSVEPADPLAGHLTGMLAYLGMLESLLSCQAIWCKALDGGPAPRPCHRAAAA